MKPDGGIEEAKVEAGEEGMDDIFKDFQSTLKEVLKDEGSAEQTMQSMEQMMQFIKQNVGNLSEENVGGETTPTTTPTDG